MMMMMRFAIATYFETFGESFFLEIFLQLQPYHQHQLSKYGDLFLLHKHHFYNKFGKISLSNLSLWGNLNRESIHYLNKVAVGKLSFHPTTSLHYS